MSLITTEEVTSLRNEQETVFLTLLANADATVYNKRIVGGNEYYQRSLVEDIAWQHPTKGLNNFNQDNSATILIPFSRTGYSAPVAWLSQPTGTWTLQVGDVLVKGNVPNLITGSYSISDLKRAYDDVVFITEIDAVSQGIILEHFRVGAK